MNIRAFIAVELRQEIQQSLKAIQEHLKKTTQDVKWVESKNIHLTLKFLGDIKERDVLKIADNINRSLSSFNTFNTELTTLGAFPSLQKPKVIWVGLNHNEKKIEAMAKSLEEALGKIGIKKETRNFHPHITIGRVKSSKDLSQLGKALQDVKIESEKAQLIQHITLFKSTLTSQGPIYEKLHTIELK